MTETSILSRLALLFLLQHIWAVPLANGLPNCLSGDAGANCTFFRSPCQWESTKWKVNAYFREISLDTHTHINGTMQTPLLCSTGWADHCLTFHYQFLYQYKRETTLTVLLDVEGLRSSVPVWRLADDNLGVFEGQAPIKTTRGFKILFQASRPTWNDPGAGSYVKIKDIVYTRTECSVTPVDAQVRKPPVTTTSTPSVSPRRLITAAPIRRTTLPRPAPSSTRVVAPTLPSRTTPDLRTVTRVATTLSALIVPSTPKRVGGMQTTTSSTRSGSEDEDASVSSKPSGILIAVPSDKHDEGGESSGISGTMIGTVVAVIGAMIIVGVMFIVAKHKRLLCFRSSTESWKAVQLDSWQYEDVSATSAPVSREDDSGYSQPTMTQFDIDHYNIVNDTVIYATAHIPTTTTTTTTTITSNHLQPFLPPVYAVVNKPRKGDKSVTLTNKLLERRRSSHKLNTLPLLRKLELARTTDNTTEEQREEIPNETMNDQGSGSINSITNMAVKSNNQSETSRACAGACAAARKRTQRENGQHHSPSKHHHQKHTNQPTKQHPSPKHTSSDRQLHSSSSPGMGRHPEDDSAPYYVLEDLESHYHVLEGTDLPRSEEFARTGDYDDPDYKDHPHPHPGIYMISGTLPHGTRPHPTTEDEYRCLDFAARRGKKKEEEEGEDGEVYGRLGGGEDNYDHVQRDRKPLVLDQVYHHLQ